MKERGEELSKKKFSQVVRDLNTGPMKDLDWSSPKIRNAVKYQKKKESESTIFVTKIPDATSAKDLWGLFNMGGNVKDIILLRKRDKRNKRFGFVKTYSELEAGEIISNVKQFKGLGRILGLSINAIKEKISGSNGMVNQGKHSKPYLQKQGLRHDQGKNSNNENSSENIFEYIESAI